MTMHVVLGDGDMTRKELTETLHDLWDKANEASQTFWFLVQAKPEPTDTDKNLMKWLATNEVYYETIGDGSEVPDIYDGTQQRHTVKRLGPKVLSLMNEKPEDGEDADLLGLFVSDDPEDEADRWLIDVMQTVAEGGFPLFALNDGLMEVDLSEEEGPEEEPEPEEEEEAPAPAKKAAAKKAAAPAKKAAAAKAPAAEDEEAPEPEGDYTREDLEERSLDELKEIASTIGISLPPRTRMTTYIDAILGEGKETPTVEVAPEEAPVSVASGPALLVVVFNGTVTTIPVSPERAQEILAG